MFFWIWISVVMQITISKANCDTINETSLDTGEENYDYLEKDDMSIIMNGNFEAEKVNDQPVKRELFVNMVNGVTGEAMSRFIDFLKTQLPSAETFYKMIPHEEAHTPLEKKKMASEEDLKSLEMIPNKEAYTRLEKKMAPGNDSKSLEAINDNVDDS